MGRTTSTIHLHEMALPILPPHPEPRVERLWHDLARALSEVTTAGEHAIAAGGIVLRSIRRAVGRPWIGESAGPQHLAPVVLHRRRPTTPAGMRPPLVVVPAQRLSRREVEVLRLVAEGRSNREIGELLFISSNTAANHVRSILQKTGATNRAEAVAFAGRRGLLE